MIREREEIGISIVIPTYNEEERLPRTLAAAKEYLETLTVASEIIISDDCSGDKTLDVAAQLLEGTNFRILPNVTHRGKGWVVRNGILATRGDVILVTDADFCTPFSSLNTMLPWLEDGYQCIIGTRKHKVSVIIAPQPSLRRLLGRIYIITANTILGLSQTDINCGFKLFEKNAAHKLFQMQRQWGWEYDAEILFLAHRLGYRVKEVPITWSHKKGSKIQPSGEVLYTLVCLMKIRWAMWNKKYETGRW